MNKRILILLTTAIILISFAFSGCGSKSANETPQTQQVTQPVSLSELLSKGKTIPGMSCDVITSSQEKLFQGKLWTAGNKSRLESVEDNEKAVDIVDEDNGVVYLYKPAKQMAFKIELSLSANNTGHSPLEYMKILEPEKVKVLETTVYEGALCRVLLIQEEIVDTKMWVRENDGIPARVEAYLKGSNELCSLNEYKNIKIGPVPADYFQLPAGVTIVNPVNMAN